MFVCASCGRTAPPSFGECECGSMKGYILSSAPRPVPWRGDPAPKFRQTKLFSGMNLAPGQLDLFATDGQPEPCASRDADGEPMTND